MIIRSQNKKELHNLDGIKMISVTTNSQNYFVEVNSQKTIGKYSTEEKAIKVLDMIQEEYGKHYYGQGGQMATADIYIQPFAFIPPKVFQMPSDEEVEV